MQARLPLLLAALGAATAFYLPGVAPKDFKQGEHVDIKVNKLTSTRTQLPYEYYSLPFCQPTALENVAENLGEVLRGDRIMNSDYDVKMGVEETCKILCRKELTQVEIKEFSLRVEEDYRVHWVTDNLPSATKYVDETNPNKPVTIYDLGFPLGFRGSSDIPGTKEGTNYLNNHLLITIKYHKDPSFDVRSSTPAAAPPARASPRPAPAPAPAPTPNTPPEPSRERGLTSQGSRIVGFEVEPSSIRHTYSGAWKGGDTSLSTCGGSTGSSPLPMDSAGEVVFTYDVKWEYSEIKWASRWDTYLLMGDEQIHWWAYHACIACLYYSMPVEQIHCRAPHRATCCCGQLAPRLLPSPVPGGASRVAWPVCVLQP